MRNHKKVTLIDLKNANQCFTLQTMFIYFTIRLYVSLQSAQKFDQALRCLAFCAKYKREIV